MRALTPLQVLLILLMAATSIWLTYWIASDAWVSSRQSDEQIVRGFTAAAREDILGYGFWFTWLLLAAVQAIALVGIWLIGRTRGLRLVALVLTLFFCLVSYFDYSSFRRTEILLNAGMGR